MEKSRLIQLLNEVDEAHTYMDGGEGKIRSIFPIEKEYLYLSPVVAKPYVMTFDNDFMLRHFDWLRQNPGLTEHGYTSCRYGIPVVMGDFIKAGNLSFSGIVEGENWVKEWPVWVVRGPNGLSFILKSQAEFIAPDWEREVTEHDRL